MQFTSALTRRDILAAMRWWHEPPAPPGAHTSAALSCAELATRGPSDGRGFTRSPLAIRHLCSQWPFIGSSSLRKKGSDVAPRAASWNEFAYGQLASLAASARGIACVASRGIVSSAWVEDGRA